MNCVIKPKLLRELKKKKLRDIDKTDKIIDALFENEKVSKKIEKDEFNGCVFKNVDFSDYPISDINLIDCVFESCDLSNSYINQKLLLRVTFNNCLLVGANIIESSIKNVTFSECNMDYINIASEYKNVNLNSCMLRYSRLFENKLDNVMFDKCDLSNSEIYKTKLKGIDLSSCIIDDISSDISSVVGVTVDYSGMVSIAKVLGINIKF